jgi:hypothetical protein
VEHPFFNTDEIAKMKLEDIQSKITELTNKLGVAYNTSGNQYLIHQLSMALDSYNTAYQKKLSEMFPKDTEEKYKNKIDIS